MVRQAVADLNIDLAQSWFIGDTTTDVQAAQNASVRSILVRTGAGGRDGKHTSQPDHEAPSLLDAVKFLVEQPARPADSR
jgi:phosphoglycolate phosphatase-like HAD superfamily hydrolase